MGIHMSPEYQSCPECGDGECWLLIDGQIMCANWPDCAVILGTWQVNAETAALLSNRLTEE